MWTWSSVPFTHTLMHFASFTKLPIYACRRSKSVDNILELVFFMWNIRCMYILVKDCAISWYFCNTFALTGRIDIHYYYPGRCPGLWRTLPFQGARRMIIAHKLFYFSYSRHCKATRIIYYHYETG